MRQVWMAVLVVVAVAAAGMAGSVVAVAPFRDEAATGLANLGPGLGDMLGQRLSRQGFLVGPPGALQAWVAQHRLLPTPDSWRAAAVALGAEVLILPAVERFQATAVAFTLFLFTVRGATVLTEVRGEVVRLATGASETVRGRGEASGATSVEVALHFPLDVCLGGFRTDKSVYYSGETVTIGFRDPLPPRSFYVVVRPVAAPTPSWTSAPASSTVASPCVTWTWNQLFPPAAAAGDYLAELYEVGNPVPLATRTFTITPAAAVELVVGSPAFGTAPWGEALAKALDELAAKIGALLRPPRGG